MLNIRFILKMLGMMCILETIFMLVATLVSFLNKGDDLNAFISSSAMMLGTGLFLMFLGRKSNDKTAGRREGMLIVSLTWLFLSFLGMLPYYLSGYINNITDAFFETMSGFTTTGASILPDIEALPSGLLFWRSLTQWQGGIGVIVFTVALLPMIGVGATQMFDAETTGVTHERFLPRVTQVAKRIWGVYLFLTLVLVGLLFVGPMGLSDAVNHAMTTISTGGYSTKNASIAYWDSTYTEMVMVLFMFIGSTNITLIYFFLKGDFRRLTNNEEFRWFGTIVVVATGFVLTWLLISGVKVEGEAFTDSLFHVITMASSSGFYTTNFTNWGAFVSLFMLIIMAISGCAGSTSGGLKVGRFIILTKNLFNEFRKQTHPHAIIPVRMNGHAVSVDIVQRVLAFTFAYICLILISSLLLMLNGLGGFEESIGAAVAAISNAGLGLGELAFGNYAEVPDFSKWYLSILMMVGRLEIFTVLTILIPGFWKQ